MNRNEIKPYDETNLAGLDAIVVFDRSGSMEDPSHLDPTGKTTRYEEIAEVCIGIARQAAKIDKDGITMIAFNNGVDVFDNVQPDQVKSIFDKHPPGGGTNLHLALQAAVDKAKSSEKKTAVMVFTDGQPNPGTYQAVIDVLNKAGKELGRSKIGFVFSQVGKDQKASEFLAALDDDIPIDICDTMDATEASGLTYPELAYCAFNG